MSGRSCDIPGCTGIYKARGYCRTHYSRLQQGLPLDAPKGIPRPARACEWGECREKVTARDLCRRHYYRARNGSDMDAPSHLGRSVYERFFEKVEDSEGGCWMWTGSRVASGYGRFGYNGATRFAYAAAYDMFVGPVPSGRVLDHVCRNKPCVNPEHLRVVTVKENAENMHPVRLVGGAEKHRGVDYMPELGKWRARVKHNYQEIHVGTFATAEEAASAAADARRIIFTHSDADKVLA